jgi:hypothetical protein
MTEAKAKTVNYTEEMVSKMLEMYASQGNEGLDSIAEAINRPKRSVIAKLVREGVYVATPKGAKVARDEGPSKKELLNELEPLVSFDVNGLSGATKGAIAAVIALARAAGESEGE